MNLYVMRHGIALPADDSSAAADAARPLSPKGIKRTRKIAKGIRRLGLSFDVLLASPLTRARQPADLVAAALGSEASVEEMPDLAPDTTVERLLAALTRYGVHADLLLVGHAPVLNETVAHLLSGAKPGRNTLHLELKKGGLCRIEIDGVPPPTPGKLHWFLTPKHLRCIGEGR